MKGMRKSTLDTLDYKLQSQLNSCMDPAMKE